jgi:hypothetical protein
MGRRCYIFLTFEGFTYSNPEASEPDVENIKVIGFAEGKNKEDAFLNLIKENPWLLDTYFDEVVCLELKEKLEDAKYFYLDDFRKKNDNI